MEHRLYHSAKSVLPFLGLSVLAGFLSALAGTAFKLGAEWIIHLSGGVYAAVRQQTLWLPLLILGAAGLGLGASVLVSRFQSCAGGGIPTSVAAVRGIVSFRSLPSVLVLPFSALISFFCGLPLGTEGPCVQMGAAIGDGVTRCLGGKKHQPWRRYVMTGGASAGFSIATAAPISAILFSVEELHKKFSPLLLSGVSVSVLTAQVTARLLALLGIGGGPLFHLSALPELSAALLYAPLLVGIVCGLGSTVFTRFYHTMEKAVHAAMKKCSRTLVFPVLFACTAAVGVCLADSLGTGHGLVDQLLEGRTLWYMLILVFLVRALLMMAANTAGVTGGVFLPTLAFGAIAGSLCAQGLTALGLLAPEHYTLTVILGVTAFLSATSRIPLTACVFAAEAMGGIHNILPLVIAATAAFLLAELSGVEDFTDAVIQAKERAARKGKPEILVLPLTVEADSFAAGKKLWDILWPNDCVVVSVEHADEGHSGEELRPGDVITLRCRTHSPDDTAKELTALCGRGN